MGRLLPAFGVGTTFMLLPVRLEVHEIQALLAAKAGATYVSPFIGRLEDIGHVGMDVVCDILNIFDNYGFDTQVIVASIRHPQHVIEAALVGAHVATIPFNVMEKLFHHSLTDKGIESFLRDWNNIKK